MAEFDPDWCRVAFGAVRVFDREIMFGWDMFRINNANLSTIFWYRNANVGNFGRGRDSTCRGGGDVDEASDNRSYVWGRGICYYFGITSADAAF